MVSVDIHLSKCEHEAYLIQADSWKTYAIASLQTSDELKSMQTFWNVAKATKFDDLDHAIRVFRLCAKLARQCRG